MAKLPLGLHVFAFPDNDPTKDTTMKKSTATPLLALALGLLLAHVPCHADRAESVVSGPANGGPGYNPVSAFAGSGANPWVISLPMLPVDLGTTTTSGAIKTGVVSTLPAPVAAAQLSWEPVAGGRTARVRVVSAQAKRLRIHVAMADGLSPLRFRVQGNLNATPVGSDDAPTAHGGGVWLTVTDGNTADLEVFADAGVATDALDFKIDAVNVITLGVGIAPKSLGPGYSKKKEYDLTCLSGSRAYPGLDKAARSTAMIDYIDSNGQLSNACTGTLLADKGGTQTPWFATANHCIRDQAAADTAVFEWFFQASACGSAITDIRHWITAGGARLLYTDVYLEPAFLILYKQPPIGAVFSGWDTNIQVGDEVWAVHHPQGDHTMVSSGTVTALMQDITYTDTKIHLNDTVSFVYGSTEGGSSGSGLFSVANGSAYWKGTLTGGQANEPISYYTHLNSYYGNIKSWLTNTSTEVYPKVSLSSSQPKDTTDDYPAAVTLEWSATGARSCSATAVVAVNAIDFLTGTRRGWVGPVSPSGKLALKVGLTTEYTLTCQGLVGSDTQSVKVKVNPPTLKQINCLFDWAETAYPDLLSPAPAATVDADPNIFPYYYTYRAYPNTGVYVGVSSLDYHVYYLGPDSGPDRIPQDLGELWVWLAKAPPSCQSM
jgi:hypothetical protein